MDAINLQRTACVTEGNGIADKEQPVVNTSGTEANGAVNKQNAVNPEDDRAENDESDPPLAFEREHVQREVTKVDSFEEKAVAFAKAFAVFVHETETFAGCPPEAASGPVAPKRISSREDFLARESAAPDDAPRYNLDRPELAQMQEPDDQPLVTTDTLAELFASRLKQAIAQSPMTQKQIATKIGVAPSVVSRILKNPDRSKLETLYRIASAIGMPLSGLV